MRSRMRFSAKADELISDVPCHLIIAFDRSPRNVRFSLSLRARLAASARSARDEGSNAARAISAALSRSVLATARLVFDKMLASVALAALAACAAQALPAPVPAPAPLNKLQLHKRFIEQQFPYVDTSYPYTGPKVPVGDWVRCQSMASASCSDFLADFCYRLL